MKIIKKGKKPKPINSYKIVCKNCHTEFEYGKDDIKEKLNKYIEYISIPKTIYEDYYMEDYIKEKVKYVECPLCKEQDNIDKETISTDTLTFSQMISGRRDAFEKQIGWDD